MKESSRTRVKNRDDGPMNGGARRQLARAAVLDDALADAARLQKELAASIFNLISMKSNLHGMTLALLLVLAAAAHASVSVSASCEVVVDNMSPRTSDEYKTDSYGNNKTLNLLGGDYGVDSNSSLSFNFASSDGFVGVNPGWVSNPSNSDAGLHPDDILASNYFYFKFVWDDQISSTDFGVTVCEDLTVYQGLYLNISMPTGSDVYLTLTQKNANCTERIQDSAYVKLSQFHTPNGTPQTIFIPFSLMKYEFDGVTPYNFAHAKDATFVNFNPPNVQYKFYHIGLVDTGSTCTPANATGVGVSATGSSSAAGTSTKTGAGVAAVAGTGAGAFMAAAALLL
ncbi:hypothetical protein HDU83_006677 [Entophlyctis luteolus]|nr:hypothetical protein HDU83_006677 [Entophlyctis luteolus]